MNHVIENTAYGSVPAKELSDWALAHGVGALTTQEVSHLIGAPANQVPQRMAQLRKSSKMISPARGLWIPVPPEYRTWGAPDPISYIDDMMGFLKADYCVGWLTSAALHGASHHAAQVFQVATSKTVSNREIGRSRLEFFAREHVGAYTKATIPALSVRAYVASSGTTMLMLASDEQICGGISNVANLIIELAEQSKSFAKDITADAALFSDASLRRVGWILEEFGDGAPEALADICSTMESEPSFLSASRPRVGKLNSRWNLIVNEEVDIDV